MEKIRLRNFMQNKISGDQSGEIIVLVLIISGMLAFTMTTLSIYSVNQANYLNRVREAYQMMSVTESIAKSFGQSKELANTALEQLYMQQGDNTDGSTLSKNEVDAYITANGLAVTSDTIQCDSTGRMIRWTGSDPSMGGAAFCGSETEYCVNRLDTNEEVCATTVVNLDNNKIKVKFDDLNPMNPMEKLGTMIARNFSFGKTPARNSSRELILNGGSGLKMLARYVSDKIQDADVFQNIAVAASVGAAVELSNPVSYVTLTDGTIVNMVDLYYNYSGSARLSIIDNLPADQKLNIANYVQDSIERISNIDTATGNYLDVDDAKELYDVLLAIASTSMGFDIMGSHSGNADGTEDGSSNRNLWRYRDLVLSYYNTVKTLSPTDLLMYTMDQCNGYSCPDSLGALDMLVTKESKSAWADTDSDWGDKITQNIDSYSADLALDVVASSAGYDPTDFTASASIVPESNFDEVIQGPDHRKEGARIIRSCAYLNHCIQLEAETTKDAGGLSVFGRSYRQNIFVQ